MANKVTIEVIVSDNGTAKLVQKSIDGVGKAADDTTKKTRGAKKAQDEYNYSLNQGVTGVSSAARSFSKLSQAIGDGPNGLVGAYATLAANAFAVSAAFNTLREAAQVTQLIQGLEVQGNKTGRTLSLVANNIAKITEGSLSAAESMRAAAQGSTAGLTASDLESLTQVATNASKVLGRNLPDSMDRIIKGVTKLEPELLDELGLMTKLTEATEKYARAQGKSAESLTGLEKRKAFVEAIKQEGELKFGGIEGQIDPNRYDQLAAKFKDLTQTTLEWINGLKILNFTLDILTNTSYGLAGALVLFGSTIGKQVIGWLYGMATAASIAAVKSKELAAEQMKEAASALAVNRTKIAGAAKELAEARNLTSKTPRGFANNIDDMEAGRASAEQYKESINSLERSNRSYEASVKRLKASTEANTEATKAAIAAKNEEIAANQIRIAATRDMQSAQETAAKSELQNRSSLLQAQHTRLNSIRTESAAIALNQASQFKLSETVQQVSKSTKAYYLEQQKLRASQVAAAAAAGTAAPAFMGLKAAWDSAKTAGYGLILTTKAVGATIISALPWIGIIMMLVSAVEMLYDKFFVSEAEKKKKAAYEELGQVLDSLKGKIEELNRVQESQTAIGARSIQALLIQSNAAAELAEAYLKVSEASVVASINESKAAEERKLLANSYGLGATGDRALGAMKAQQEEAIKLRKDFADSVNASMDSKAVQFMLPTAETSGILFWKDYTEETKQTTKALSDLEKLSPSLADKFYSLAKSTDTQAQKTALLNKIMEAAKNGFGPLGRAVENFKSILQSTEEAQTDLMRSLKPSTSFDAVVDNFNALIKSTRELEKAMNNGDISSKDFVATFEQLMTAIGPNTRKVLDIDTQGTLQVLEDVDARIQLIQSKRAELVADGAAKNKEAINNIDKELNGQKNIVGLLTQRSNLEAQLVKPIKEGLEAYRDQAATAQILTITSQSLVTLAQARLSLIQRQGTVTGEDVKRQMRAHNAVIAAQQQEQKIKLSFIEIDINKNKLLMQNIEAQLRLLKVLKDQEEVTKKQQLLEKMRTLEAEKKQNTPEYREAASQYNYINTPSAARKSEEELQSSLRDLQRSNDVNEAAAASIRTSMAALGMSAYSSEEINTAAAKQDIANMREAYGYGKEILDLVRSRAQVETKLAESMEMGLNTLQNEINAIKANAAARRAQLQTEYRFKKKELELDIALAASRGLQNQVAYYNNILTLTTEKFNVETDNLETLEREEILSKVLITSAEDYYGRLQEVANIKQKITEATIQEMEAQSRLNEATFDLEVLKRGITDRDAIQQLKSIKEAEDNLARVRAEADIKKQLIFLEFELLKAKRAQTLADLSIAKLELEKQREGLVKKKQEAALDLKRAKEEEARLAEQRAKKNTSGSLDNTGGIVVTAAERASGDRVRLAEETLSAITRQSNNIDTQLTNMENITTYWSNVTDETFDRASKSLTRALELGGDEAAKRLQIALTDGPMVQNGFSSLLENMKARQEVREKKKRSETSVLDVSRTVLEEMNVYIEGIKSNLEALGPEGEIVLAAISAAQSIGSAFVDAFKVMGDANATSNQKTVAGLQAVSAVIAGVSSILQATSNAKIANIDKEIAAEEKRDGKSAASVEKIKAMEKKKDEIARKSFNVQKKLMMAQAVVSTAAAIAMAIGQLGPIAGPIMAGVMAAMGAAQIAIIAGTQYESALSNNKVEMPSTLSIGKRDNAVDLAKGPNANAGGEVAYLRGSEGTGSNASNYRTVGSAYGGDLTRGYGNRGFVVGEKGPEVINPDTPITVTPANEVQGGQPLNATFNIQALDASGVQDILVSQKGNIIKMLRDAANASGQRFMEDVNVNVYTRPNVGKL